MRAAVASILFAVFSAALASYGAPAARAGGPSPPSLADQEKIARLIKELGNDDCKTRETASEQLAELGMATKDALIAALEHPDLEIRIRARQLLVVVLAEDFRRRLAEFAEDVDDRRGLDLPYWKQFKQVAGGDTAARALFVGMQRGEAPLLAAASQGPKPAAEALKVRIQLMQARPVQMLPGQNRRGLSLEAIAALIVVASDPEVTLDPYLSGSLASFPSNQAFRQALAEGGDDGLARRIFKHWIAQPAGEKSQSLAINNLSVAIQLKMPECVTPALQVLAAQTPVPTFRQQAILAIGKYGTREHSAALEPLLQDQSKCGRMAFNGAPVDIQVRDVALAVMVHLSGQDPKDYGYEFIQPNEETLYSYGSLGFNDSDQRDAAFKKWEAWTAMQKK